MCQFCNSLPLVTDGNIPAEGKDMLNMRLEDRTIMANQDNDSNTIFKLRSSLTGQGQL